MIGKCDEEIKDKIMTTNTEFQANKKLLNSKILTLKTMMYEAEMITTKEDEKT